MYHFFSGRMSVLFLVIFTFLDSCTRELHLCTVCTEVTSEFFHVMTTKVAFQAIDVLNGIAWDKENDRIFGNSRCLCFNKACCSFFAFFTLVTVLLFIDNCHSIVFDFLYSPCYVLSDREVMAKALWDQVAPCNINPEWKSWTFLLCKRLRQQAY